MVEQRLNYACLRRRNRRRPQFRLLTLLILAFLAQILLSVFAWLRPDQAVRTGLASALPYDWLLMATYAGFLVLFGVVLGVLQGLRPRTSFAIFAVLLLAACCFTLHAYGSHERYVAAGRPPLLSDRQMVVADLLLISVPGVWILVLAAGLGVGISIQNHPGD